MGSPFKHFDGEANLLPQWQPKVPHPEGDIENKVRFEISDLADVARTFFRGMYPKESPYFAWGQMIELRWAEKYWLPTDRSDTVMPAPIIAEVTALAGSLREAWAATGEHRLTFVTPALQAPQLKIQGLAVEMLIHLDRLVGLLNARDHLPAMALLSEVYKYVSDLTLEAIYQLGVGDDAVRVIERIREGAAKGGMASAQTRRRESRIPAPAALRAERARLIEAGKAEREVAGILAQRYSCSPDHIRKLFMRD